MKNLSFLIVLMTSAICFANPSFLNTDVQLNGDKILIQKDTNNPITGLVITNFDNGNKWKEINYLNGIKEDVETWYWPNGNKRFIVHWKEGKYHGTLEEYRQDGTSRQVRTYKNGIQDGKQTWFHKNGQEASSIYFKDGKELKEGESYYETGEKMLDGTPTNNPKEFKVYYKNGQIKFLGQTDEATNSGTATIYYRTGGKAMEIKQEGNTTSGVIYNLAGDSHAMSEDEIKTFQFMSGFGFFVGPDKGWDDKLLRGFIDDEEF